MHLKPNSVKSILIIKRGALGDLLAGTAGIGSIRRYFKQAHICLLSDGLAHVVCPEGSIVDEIINEKDFLKSKLGYFNLWRLIHKRKFDLIVNMRWMSEISGVLTLLGGSKYSAGAGSTWLRNRFKFSPPFSKDEANCHEYLLNLRIAQSIGITETEPSLYLHQRNTDVAFANEFYTSLKLNPSKTLIVTPIASTPLKAWPPERFIQISKQFLATFNATIVLTYAPNDETEILAIKNAIGDKAILAPKTTINQLAAIVSKASLCLCNNSGIMHVAFAVNTPVVCVNTSIGWAPYGNNSVAITQLPDHGNNEDNRRLTNQQTSDLLHKISVERVWIALSEKWITLHQK